MTTIIDKRTQRVDWNCDPLHRKLEKRFISTIREIMRSCSNDTVYLCDAYIGPFIGLGDPDVRIDRLIKISRELVKHKEIYFPWKYEKPRKNNGGE